MLHDYGGVVQEVHVGDSHLDEQEELHCYHDNFEDLENQLEGELLPEVVFLQGVHEEELQVPPQPLS